MAASAWTFYNTFKELMADGTIDLDTDTFKIALFTSASNCSTATWDDYTDLDNEHANGNGYTTGGYEVTPTWGQTAGTATFDCTDATWTASGGSIVARYAVLYSVTSGKLVAYTLLDTTPADVTVTTGNTLTIQIHTSGVFTLT